MMGRPFIHKLHLWFVSFAVPLVLVLGTVRLMMNPWFVEFEYRTPGFPADPYGFTFEERLAYSKVAIEYLVNDADISFLADLRFPEGQTVPDFSCQFMEDCNRMYNERELKHMEDVKSVVHSALRIWWAALIFLFLTGIWSWRAGWWVNFRLAVRRGGFLTLPFIGLILTLTLLAFGAFFVFFHDLFFAAGTWTFYFSDTLIRMFPERFWRDTFLTAGLLSGLGGLILGWVVKPQGSDREERPDL
jgi:integral membrane protein (TIGR01906 family)